MSRQSKSKSPFTFVFALLLCLLCVVGLYAAVNIYLTIGNGQHKATLEKPLEGTARFSFDYSWARQYPYVAHAMGGILGQNYTNSYEAFLMNYELGHRVFEADLYLTDDNRTVLTHDGSMWRAHASLPANDENGSSTPAKDVDFTYTNFMSSLWYDKYHTLDLEGLLVLMEQHPDVYIITDSKFYDEERVRLQFNELVSTAMRIDPTLLDRIIVEIYVPEMLDWVMDIYPWKSVICSLYRDWASWTPEKVSLFVEDSGIGMVCLGMDVMNQSLVDMWKDEGAEIITYTVNNLATVGELEKMGVHAYMTDYIDPNSKTTSQLAATS